SQQRITVMGVKQRGKLGNDFGSGRFIPACLVQDRPIVRFESVKKGRSFRCPHLARRIVAVGVRSYAEHSPSVSWSSEHHTQTTYACIGGLLMRASWFPSASRNSTSHSSAVLVRCTMC